MAEVHGIETVIQNINVQLEKIEKKTLSGLNKAAREIRRDMDNTYPVIPVDKGNLRKSWFRIDSKGGRVRTGKSPQFTGKIAPRLARDHSQLLSSYSSMAKEYGMINRLVVIMGFSTYYAWPVHEKTDPNVNWSKKGSGPKFFEASLKRNKNKILETIRKEAKV